MTTTAVSKSSAIPCGNLICEHALLIYYLIAFGISWLYALVAFTLLRIPDNTLTIIPYLLGPTIGAWVMTAATEGKPGLRRLIQRYVHWRVNLTWYLVVLIGIPLVYTLGILVLPGATASFQLGSEAHWLAYPLNVILILFLGGPFFEEPGWRGFALPRFQERSGPLVGSLMVGLLWAAWHLPVYFLPTFASENGGLSLTSIGVFGLSALAFAILLTWVFNHTRGSLLLAMLAHASLNAFQGYANRLFPTQANSEVGPMIGFVGLALLILLLTRGQMGYSTYQEDQRRLGGGA